MTDDEASQAWQTSWTPCLKTELKNAKQATTLFLAKLKMTTSIIERINEEVAVELKDQGTLALLAKNTFKGLSPDIIKSAIIEGMLRGFNFKDFLQKNVYAVGYGSTYSLVTSIDYSRKIGQKSGVVGVEEPIYKDNADGSIETCTVTVKKKTGDYIGDFTATVYFKEYSTGKNLWVAKPRTMIAKVAEMHALRKACPEELAQAYAEEEIQKVAVTEVAIDLVTCAEKLEAATTIDELKNVWKDFTPQERNIEELKALFITQKNKIASETEPA